MKSKKTNYCTLAPDNIFGYYIGGCCHYHDDRYKDDPKKMTRKEADIKFLRCMKSILPLYLHFVAYSYYYAVRLFSGPGWERWKYKWYFGIIAIRRQNG